MRPTRNRLLVAMGISTVAISVLLMLLAALADLARRQAPGFAAEEVMSVVIRNAPVDAAVPTAEPESSEAAPDPEPETASVAGSPRAEVATTRPAGRDSKIVKDWRAILAEAAIAAGDEKARLEKHQASNWQRSRSVMFQPSADRDLREEPPALANFRFKPRVHVAGIGVTIGSCFIGIPLAGVPVEQRTVAISVFVCAPDS